MRDHAEFWRKVWWCNYTHGHACYSATKLRHRDVGLFCNLFKSAIMILFCFTWSYMGAWYSLFYPYIPQVCWGTLAQLIATVTSSCTLSVSTQPASASWDTRRPIQRRRVSTWPMAIAWWGDTLLLVVRSLMRVFSLLWLLICCKFMQLLIFTLQSH